jgi:hypothetical protein
VQDDAASTPPVQADLLTVEQVFADPATSYVVPVYQRNYAWRAEQIEQLVDDVWTAARDGQTERYFLGNLVVARRTTSETDGSHLEIIDGQQRLTTLSLLLRALPGDDTEPARRLRYASRPKATAALSSLGTSDDEDGTGIPTAYKVVRQALEARVGAGNHEEFATYLRTQVHLVRATLGGDTDLNRYFEIMNTRGQQLEQVDIVKARLMRHLGDDPAAQDCFAWVWDACRDLDAYVQMTLTRAAATGRRAELRGRIFGATWDCLQVRSFGDLQALAAEHGGGGTEGAPVPGGDSRSLAESLRAYAAAPAEDEAEDVDSVRFRSPIGFPSLLLHVLKVLDTRPGPTTSEEDGRERAGGEEPDQEDADEGRLDDNRLIRLFDERFGALSPAFGSTEVKRFVEELLRCRFVLDNYLLKREYTATNGDDGAWSLKRLVRSRSDSSVRTDKARPAYPASFADGDADDVADAGTEEVLMLQSMLRVTYTSPRTMHWITALLRLEGLEDNGSTRAAEVRDTLQRFARRRVEQAFFAGTEPTGFAVERIVFTYLDYLLARDQGTGYRFAFRNSVEHFFPQSPDQDQAAGALVPRGLHSFGNLALISVGANSKFSNNMPRLKVGFRSLIEQSPKLVLMARLAEQPGSVWDDTAIARHREQMVALLRRDLGLTTG